MVSLPFSCPAHSFNCDKPQGHTTRTDDTLTLTWELTCTTVASDVTVLSCGFCRKTHVRLYHSRSTFGEDQKPIDANDQGRALCATAKSSAEMLTWDDVRCGLGAADEVSDDPEEPPAAAVP